MPVLNERHFLSWYHKSMPLQGVFGRMTRVTRVSSDNANIVAEHQGPAEVLSKFGDTSNPQFIESESVTIVAASGVPVVASGLLNDSSLFSLEIALSTKPLTHDFARTKVTRVTRMSLTDGGGGVGSHIMVISAWVPTKMDRLF